MPTIRFERHAISLSQNTIGTDGLNALLRIPGVSDPEVVEETEDYVVISYTWDPAATAPEGPEGHFRSFGLQRTTSVA